ncbi:hypothetical protein GIB67_005878 [Kingdonia uniflora]|uniref:Uncharacterized protein n=1 Tax=Kingdonia uniflora TaxID=39325 RepID=A0A7J7MBR2_9MAGN|nr:hypothetical protein GIB67_005878 [Kingdonia uniflora]
MILLVTHKLISLIWSNICNPPCMIICAVRYGSSEMPLKFEKDQTCLALIPSVMAQPETASTVPRVQQNKGPCGVHGRAVGVYQPSSRARRASDIQLTDARATSG